MRLTFDVRSKRLKGLKTFSGTLFTCATLLQMFHTGWIINLNNHLIERGRLINRQIRLPDEPHDYRRGSFYRRMLEKALPVEHQPQPDNSTMWLEQNLVISRPSIVNRPAHNLWTNPAIVG